MAFISSGEDLFFAQHDKAVTLLPKMVLPGMLLLPSPIILMCLAMIRSSFITIVRGRTYWFFMKRLIPLAPALPTFGDNGLQPATDKMLIAPEATA